MIKCPECKSVIYDESIFCPYCNHVFDKDSPFATVDDEIERMAMMAFNMENRLGDEFQNKSYTADEIEKILSGEMKIHSDDDDEENFEEVESIFDGLDLEDHELFAELSEIEANEARTNEDVVVEDSTQVVFKASGGSIKKVTEEDEIAQREELKKRREAIKDNYKDSEVVEQLQDDYSLDDNDNDDLNEYLDGLDDSSNDDLENIFNQISNDNGEAVDKDSLSSDDEELVQNIESIVEDNTTTENDEIKEESSEYNFDNFDDFDLDIETHIRRSSQIKDIFSTDTYEDMFKKSHESEQIDKKISEFLNEVKDIDLNQRVRDDLNETYLKLNFVTTDKFATLISSENERVDIASNNVTGSDKTMYTDVFGVEAIIDAETLSEEELNMTIEAVNIQKVEIISNLEQEEKDMIIGKYKQVRTKMFNLLKLGSIIGLVIISCFFIAYLFDFGIFNVQSKIYLPSSVETYDIYMYGSILEIKDIAQEVADDFKLYNEGQFSDSEMIDICNVANTSLNKYKTIFDKHIYDEAEQYIFEASNAYFFASYFIDNIRLYIETKDDYYIHLNDKAKSETQIILDEVSDARIEFLKEIGYSDDEINILNYKAESSR